MINCLAYVDLNPVRAGLVEKPEQYRWCSLGYHVQADNQGNFLSLDFGLSTAAKLSKTKRLALFAFVYIHPYMDGNGRMGRFLMNLMSASGGYPWIVIPVKLRAIYIKALEEASVHQNIVPFTDLVAGLVRKMAGR